MHKFFLSVSAILLGACSFIEQPYKDQRPLKNIVHSHGNYAPCHVPNPCMAGQGYSVAASQNIHPNFMPYNMSPPPMHSLTPTYIGPVPPAAQHPQYGSQQYHNYGQNGYGPHTPHLRGMHNSKPATLYGTLGGVLYNEDIDVFGIEGRLGYDSGGIFGAELEGSFGVVSENKTVDNALIGDVKIDTGFNYNVAAFALARLPVSPRFSVHGRAGYDFRRLTVDGTAEDGTFVSRSSNLDGVAYGAGAEYALTPYSGLRFDLTRYENDIGRNNSISASFTRKF
jgi:opacity protein-like surface antigen